MRFSTVSNLGNILHKAHLLSGLFSLRKLFIMGNFMMYIAYGLFCLLFLLVIFSVFFNTNRLAKGILLTCIALLLFGLIALFRTGSDLKREKISPLQYGEGEEFRRSLSL